MKKLLLFVLISVSCSSCGDIILKEKILSERPFDPVYNYQAYILAASDNNVFLSVQINKHHYFTQKMYFPTKTTFTISTLTVAQETLQWTHIVLIFK
jgi:hypothetical protein